MHGGGEEEGWGANLASTVLLLDALVRGGNSSTVWYKLDLFQRCRPLPLARCLQDPAEFLQAPWERQRKETYKAFKSAPNLHTLAT